VLEVLDVLEVLEGAPAFPRAPRALRAPEPYEPRRPDFIEVEWGLIVGTRADTAGFTGGGTSPSGRGRMDFGAGSRPNFGITGRCLRFIAASPVRAARN